MALDDIQITFQTGQAPVAPDGIPQTRLVTVSEASDGMPESAESQAGILGGMLAVTPPDEEVSHASEGMPELFELQEGMSEVSTAAAEGQEGMSEVSTAAAVGSGGMTLDNSDAMSEGIHSVMTGEIAESMDAVLMAEPVVQVSGMWGSLLASSTARGIRRHERWGRRDRHPDDSEYDD